MRSFATTLIAAALAALTTAAPTGVSTGIPTEKSVTGTLGGLQDKVHDINARADTPSIAVIFGGLSTATQPYTDQMMHIDSSDLSISQITNLVAEIKAPIAKAVPQLQALVGSEASVILAPVDNAADELSNSELAELVGDEVRAILSGVGNILEVLNEDAGQLVSDVEAVLRDLGSAVTDLVGAVIDLVEGVVAPLAEDLQPVLSVVSELHLDGLAHDLNLSP